MRGQASVEYLVILGITIGLSLAGVVYYFSYSQHENADATAEQVNTLGREVMNNVKNTFDAGRGTKRSVSMSIPDGVREIKVDVIDQRELVVQYETVAGTSEAIFYSNIPIETIFSDGTLTYVERGNVVFEFISLGSSVLVGVVDERPEPQCAVDADCTEVACLEYTCVDEQCVETGPNCISGKYCDESSGNCELTQCNDGLDNDGDGCIDYGGANPDSEDCDNVDDNLEAGSSCAPPETDLTCSIVTPGSCGGLVLVSLSGTADAHASIASLSTFTNELCCTSSSYTITGPATCATPILKLSDSVDAHAGDPILSSFTTEVCLLADPYTVDCAVRDSCGPGEAGILELTSPDDAHVGAIGSGYDYTLCCTIT